MIKELKPCPFCGSTSLKLQKKKIIYKKRKGYIASVRCNCCNARDAVPSSWNIEEIERVINL